MVLTGEMPMIYSAAALLAAIGVALVFASLRLLRPPAEDCGWDWIDSAPSKRYAPMLHLLSEEDYVFLRSQAGGSVCKKLRRERRRLFRDYLVMLKCDFNGIQKALGLLALQSPDDETDLLRMLLKQRCTFGLRLCAIEFRYLLHGLGIDGMDVRPLVALADSLCGTVHDLSRATLGTPCTLEWAMSASS